MPTPGAKLPRPGVRDSLPNGRARTLPAARAGRARLAAPVEAPAAPPPSPHRIDFGGRNAQLPAPHQEHPARQADARPSRERAAPQPAVAKPVPVPAFSEAPTASSAPPAPGNASCDGVSRPTPQPPLVLGPKAPDPNPPRSPSPARTSPAGLRPPFRMRRPFPRRRKSSASSPDLAPRASWPARLLARLKRGRAAPPHRFRRSAPRRQRRRRAEVRRSSSKVAKHGGRTPRPASASEPSRPRGPVYPYAGKRRRHLLDISLVDEEPSPNMEKEREPGSPSPRAARRRALRFRLGRLENAGGGGGSDRRGGGPGCTPP